MNTFLNDKISSLTISIVIISLRLRSQRDYYCSIDVNYSVTGFDLIRTFPPAFSIASVYARPRPLAPPDITAIFSCKCILQVYIQQHNKL